MLSVKTKIGPSNIHGFGLFADQNILKGEIVWQHDEFFDQHISEKKFLMMSEYVQQYIKRYGHKDMHHSIYILCGDNARFTNHSYKPNVEMITPNISIANRDIKIGEEITEDYRTYDEEFVEKMNLPFIDHNGYRYWYEPAPARNRKDFCLATRDPQRYCNGFYLYSDKDPGAGIEYVIRYTNEPELKKELING